MKDGAEDGPRKKKQKKKKDPNAPKRAMSGFFFFQQMEREVGLNVGPSLKEQPYSQECAYSKLWLGSTLKFGLVYKQN